MGAYRAEVAVSQIFSDHEPGGLSSCQLSWKGPSLVGRTADLTAQQMKVIESAREQFFHGEEWAEVQRLRREVEAAEDRRSAARQEAAAAELVAVGDHDEAAAAAAWGERSDATALIELHNRRAAAIADRLHTAEKIARHRLRALVGAAGELLAAEWRQRLARALQDLADCVASRLVEVAAGDSLTMLNAHAANEQYGELPPG